MKFLQRLRAETPGCAYKIHLNNAGASLMPNSVIKAMRDYLDLESNTGGYETAAAKADEIAGFYTALGTMLTCGSRNIAYAASATDAYSKALASIPFKKGDVLLTTNNDYASNQIAFLFLQKRSGVQILRAEECEKGGVNMDSVEELIKKHHPMLVAVTHVPTNSGLVQPIETIGKLCRSKEILYLVDACQSAGQMPLDVEKIGCDFLTATFRKFLRGPRGAGFLFASDRVLEQGLESGLMDLNGATWLSKDKYELGKNARRYEYWEKSYALVLGAKAAVEYALEIGLEEIKERVTILADFARMQLVQLPKVQLLDKGEQLCGIVTAHLEGIKDEMLMNTLSKQNINISITKRRHAVIDFDKKGVEWAIRISPHYYNTLEEIELLMEQLRQIMKK